MAGREPAFRVPGLQQVAGGHLHAKRPRLGADDVASSVHGASAAAEALLLGDGTDARSAEPPSDFLRLMELPELAILCVLEHMDAQDLLALLATCRFWHSLDARGRRLLDLAAQKKLTRLVGLEGLERWA
jgi:hypothetical protein